MDDGRDCWVNLKPSPGTSAASVGLVCRSPHAITNDIYITQREESRQM